MGYVGAVLLGRGDKQRPFTVEPRQMGGFVLRPTHTGDIAHPDHLPALAGDRNVAHGLKRLEGAPRFDVETPIALVDCADRRLSAGAAQGVRDGACRQPQLCELGKVDGDAHFRRRRAPVFGLANPWNAVQPVSQPVSDLLQPPHRHVAADQRGLEHLNLRRAGTLDLQACKALWKATAQGVHLANNLIVLPFRVDVPGELGLDHGGAVEV